MSDPLRDLQPGDPIPTSVRTWNPLLQLARGGTRPLLPAGPDSSTHRRQPDLWVKNSSGSAWVQYQHVVLSTPVITAAGNLDAFRRTPVFNAAYWTTGSSQPTVGVVTAAPIPNGGVGPAWIGGVCAVQVEFTAGHRFAKAKNASGNLVSNLTNGWPIVWQPAAGTNWTLVDFGQLATSVVAIQAPSGGIPAATGYVAGTATCKLLVYDGTTLKDTGETRTVANWSTEAVCVNGYRLGKAALVDGVWSIISEDCNDSRTYAAPASAPGAGGGGPGE